MAQHYQGPAQSGEYDQQGPGAPATQEDPSQVSGQDPQSFLGIPMSYSTGLGGSSAPGGEGPGAHAVSQPNEYPATEAISGVPLDGTGLPGTTGASNQIESGPGIAVTNPNNFAGNPGGVSGTVQVEVPQEVGGSGDSTMTEGFYPPAKPVVKGDHYPSSSGAGDGQALVGGYKKGQRS